MILILSIEKDLTTSNVISWLLYQDQKFARINDEDTQNIEISICNENINLSIINEKEINLNNYKKYWYRRGNFNFKNNFLKGDSETVHKINHHIDDNSDDLISYLHNFLSTNIPSINSYNDNNINKLLELSLAKDIGIKIPHTLITTKKESALDFINKHKDIITKTIKNSLNLSIDHIEFYWHTLILTKEEIENFPESFAPIKIQNCIEKAFELRVFYLEGIFYSSAIFSQNDEQTKIDFRNYNESNPNRVIPYILPKEIRKKFKKLMAGLNLKSGSLDIIVTKKGEYIFLEVNPIGQFTQVSYPCNYFLEKQMASCLAT